MAVDTPRRPVAVFEPLPSSFTGPPNARRQPWRAPRPPWRSPLTRRRTPSAARRGCAADRTCSTLTAPLSSPWSPTPPTHWIRRRLRLASQVLSTESIAQPSYPPIVAPTRLRVRFLVVTDPKGCERGLGLLNSPRLHPLTGFDAATPGLESFFPADRSSEDDATWETEKPESTR